MTGAPDPGRGPAPGTAPEASSLRVAGVIPCAGLSTRMGRSKALMDADGASFLARAVGCLREGGCDPVVVVVREREGTAEAREARSAGARVVVNPDPSDGPISSVRAALDALATGAGGRGRDTPGRPEDPAPDGVDAIAVLPVDHPGVNPGTVAALVAALATAGPAAVVVPVHQGRNGHPTLFAAGTFPELRSPELAHGARTVVRRAPDRVVHVPVDDPAIRQDIDRPADYRAWYGAPA